MFQYAYEIGNFVSADQFVVNTTGKLQKWMCNTSELMPQPWFNFS